MKKNNLKIFIPIFIILLISCERKTEIEKQNVSVHKNPIDTLLIINSEQVSLKVSTMDDLKQYGIKNGDYDSSPEEPIEDDDEYWVEYSTVFKFKFQDKNNKFGLQEAILNIDLLKEAVKNNSLMNEKMSSLDGFLLDKSIIYLGITSTGIAMFKVKTYWYGGDGGGQEWTIGVLYSQTEWSDDFKGNKHRDSPICILEVIDSSGEGFDYKNDRYFLADFIGNWSYDCGLTTIGISKADKYISVPIQLNQIYLNARYELIDGDLFLFLNYETGLEFGDFGVGGASFPWDDYSRDKPFAKLSLINKEKNKLKIKWFGLYNEKNKSYEALLPEFMNIVENKVKSDILNRCM